MKYTKYTIESTVDAEDILSAVLSDAGIEGIEIADSKPWSKDELDEIFVDEVPVNKDIPEGIALISFYLSEEDDKKVILSDIRSALEDMRAWTEVPCGTLAIASSDLDDEDYLNSWKQYFHSFDISLYDGRTMSIVPSWELDTVSARILGGYGIRSERTRSDNKLALLEENATYKKTGDLLLNIDPGTAFGTGAHETTKLCIIALSKYVKPGMEILDIGTGSGILSMAAFMFKAKRVTATDIDPNAVPAVDDNFKKNGLGDADFTMLTGNVLTDKDFRKAVGGGYDIAVANILPVVLIPLTSVIREMVRPDGIIIYSGILTEKTPAVRQALTDNSFEIIETDTLGEWCVIVAKAC